MSNRREVSDMRGLEESTEQTEITDERKFLRSIWPFFCLFRYFRLFRPLSSHPQERNVSDSSPHISEDKFQRKLDLTRIDPRAVDHAVGRRPELHAGRVPDRVIRGVEDLRSEFQILRFGQVELLVCRSVEADDARADDRVTRGISEAERSGGG